MKNDNNVGDLQATGLSMSFLGFLGVVAPQILNPISFITGITMESLMFGSIISIVGGIALFASTLRKG